MIFDDITVKSTYHYTYWNKNDLLSDFKACIKNTADPKTIPQQDVKAFIKWLTSGASRCVLRQSYSDDTQRSALLKFIVSKLTIERTDLRLFFKCCVDGNDVGWIRDWVKVNPDAILTDTDKKKLAKIGFIDVFSDSTSISQSTFESFFLNDAFIKDNFGAVTLCNPHNSYNSYKNINNWQDEMNTLRKYQNYQMITEHEINTEAIIKYVKELPSNSIIKMMDNSNIKITTTCLNNYMELNTIDGVTGVIALRIITLGNLQINFNTIINSKLIWGFHNVAFSDMLINQTCDITKDNLVKLLDMILNYGVSNSFYYFRLITKLILFDKLLILSDCALTHNDIYKCLYICQQNDGSLSSLITFVFEMCNLEFDEGVLDMAIKLNNLALCNACTKKDLTPNLTHVKYIILHKNIVLLDVLLDNKLTLDGSIIKYCVQSFQNTAPITIRIKENIFDMSEQDEYYLDMDYSSCIQISKISARPFIETLECGYTQDILNGHCYNEFLMYYILDENQFKSLNITVRDVLQLTVYKAREFFYSECIENCKETNSVIPVSANLPKEHNFVEVVCTKVKKYKSKSKGNYSKNNKSKSKSKSNHTKELHQKKKVKKVERVKSSSKKRR